MQPMDEDAFSVSATVRPLEQATKRRRITPGNAGQQYMGPGDVVTRETDVLRGHGTYSRGGELAATLSGTVERINKLVKVNPPKSRYVGEVGDIVVGRVLEVLPRRWKVDINATAAATLRLDNVQLENNEQRKRTADDDLNMRQYLRESDLVSAEIQEYKQDRSIMLQCRTRNGKLEAGSLVAVPPHLIKRLKHHYHLLSCGVSVILGCNGYVWVAPPPKVKATGETSIMSDDTGEEQTGTEVSLSTRESMCRVRNAVSLSCNRAASPCIVMFADRALAQVIALSMAELPIYPDTIMDTVEASLSAENGGVSLSSAEMLDKQHLSKITLPARKRVDELAS